MIGQQKNNRILYQWNYHLIEKSVIIFLKARCISELSWNFLKNTNIQILLLFFHSSRYVSNEQPCLKTNGLYDDLLLVSRFFHFFCFTFRAHILFSLCFPIPPSFFFMFFLKPLSSVVENLLYTYIQIICVMCMF